MGWGWLVAAVGVLMICAALYEWKWFMNDYRARLLVRLIGRTGARIFYVIFGGGLLVLGILLGLGKIK